MSADRSVYCPGPLSRRSFLEAGYMALGGMGLADLLRQRVLANSLNPQAGNREDTAVIFIWLLGGPSHME
ncbi:MAG TPA: DUF1501 domain-containing protein, partial [Planctomycetaceae bacterium]|nr:DUF1501 domain-containing protein [Planctomycetaceae bacterium]